MSRGEWIDKLLFRAAPKELSLRGAPLGRRGNLPVNVPIFIRNSYKGTTSEIATPVCARARNDISFGMCHVAKQQFIFLTH